MGFGVVFIDSEEKIKKYQMIAKGLFVLGIINVLLIIYIFPNFIYQLDAFVISMILLYIFTARKIIILPKLITGLCINIGVQLILLLLILLV